jgi:hypothetical protein
MNVVLHSCYVVLIVRKLHFRAKWVRPLIVPEARARILWLRVIYLPFPTALLSSSAVELFSLIMEQSASSYIVAQRYLHVYIF